MVHVRNTDDNANLRTVVKVEREVSAEESSLFLELGGYFPARNTGTLAGFLLLLARVLQPLVVLTKNPKL